MSKSANLYVRIEPDVKENAEMILSQLGIPMSNAVGMFLKQVVLRRGLPFDVTLPANHPLDISMLTDEEFHTELEKGYTDIEKGNVIPAKEAFGSLRSELGIGYMTLKSQHERDSIGKGYTDNLTPEDRAFVAADFNYTGELAKLMRRIDKQHEDRIIELILFFKYVAYDMSEAFGPQYTRNMEQLKRQLECLGRKGLSYIQPQNLYILLMYGSV